MRSRALVVFTLFLLGAPVPAQLPTDIRAEHRSGQTFLTWGEIPTLGKRYRVYRAEVPLASEADLALAELLGEVDDRSSRNQGRSLATGAEHGWVIATGAPELSMNKGLFVHTAERQASTAYYAVTSVQSGQETKTLEPGSNATTEPLVEVPAPPAPVLQSTTSNGQLWGHWVGNRATPFLPALSPWPSFGCDFLYEPGTGPAPRGLLVRLHAAGQTYAAAWPQRFEVQKDVDILSLSDLQPVTSWSVWYGAHEKFPGSASTSTAVRNYTQQRILWTLEWLTARLGAAHDPERMYVIGGSMGAIGAMYLVGERPDLFAAALCRNGLYDLLATDYRNPTLFQTLFGSFALDLPSLSGIPITKRTNASFMANLDPGASWPVIRTLNGRNDETVGWMSAVEMMRGFAQAERPAWHYFDERTHNPTGYWRPLEKSLLMRTFQTRRDRPSLRFLDCTLDENVGNGERTDGDTVGTINGYVDYDPLTAAAGPNALDFDVFVRGPGTLDEAPLPFAWAALVPHRTGPFALEPGEAVRMTLHEGTTAIAEHLLYADGFGRVRTPPVPLALARRHLRFERLDGAGTPTRLEELGASTPEGATELAPGTCGVGSLLEPGERDYWRVRAEAGADVALEVLAARLDAAAWTAAGLPPRVRVLSADGALELVRHEPATWPEAPRDLDFPHLLVPLEGEFLVELSSVGRGGRYALLVTEPTGAAFAPEQEPRLGGGNDAPALAEPIAPGTSVRGWAEDGGIDWYAFELAQDAVVELELHAERLGVPPGHASYPLAELVLDDGFGEDVIGAQLLGDPAVKLLRRAGRQLVGVRALPEREGEYLLALGVTPFAGTLESEPDDAPVEAMAIARGERVAAPSDECSSADWFRFEGEAGQRVELELCDGGRAHDLPVAARLLGPDGAELALVQDPALGRLAAQLETAGEHELRLELGPDYWLHLSDVRGARLEAEPNDDLARPGELWDWSVSGRIDFPGDADVFAFGARAGRLLRFDLAGPRGGTRGTGHGSRLVPRLTILHSCGAELARAEGTDLPGAVLAQGVSNLRTPLSLAFVPPQGGAYFVRVEDAAEGGGAGYGYALSMR